LNLPDNKISQQIVSKLISLKEKPEEFIEEIKIYINTNKFEFKPVTHFSLTNPKAKVMKITMENGNYIICTPEHKIYTTNRGYVMAKELLETDKLFCDS
jgi:intein/homing endonuclease